MKTLEIKKLDFESIYFDLYELNSGIYAAISAEKLPSSNAGFFDLGNYLIIFDTLMDPFATLDLIKASKQYTNKTPSFVINSHYHMDHLFGNRKFSQEIPIISSFEASKVYYENLEETLKRFKGIANDELKRIKEDIKNETNPDKILELTNDISTYTEIIDDRFKLRPPDFLISDSFMIQGTKNQLVIRFIGDAHTSGDIIALFEKEQICFMGDLLFEETDPNWVTQETGAPKPSNPKRLCDTLLNYMEKNIEIYVPGHGKLCNKKQLKENVEFFGKNFITDDKESK
ncbi:MAG: MBL fold metallo-hydrolase [Candidatus Hermodarchaeota archaeon]